MWAPDDTNNLSVELRVHQTLETTHPLYRFGVGLYNTIQLLEPEAARP
jgi:hypothetical protein